MLEDLTANTHQGKTSMCLKMWGEFSKEVNPELLGTVVDVTNCQVDFYKDRTGILHTSLSSTEVIDMKVSRHRDFGLKKPNSAS